MDFSLRWWETDFKGQNGVNLNGRKKVHGEGEKCPVENVGYCKCKTRGDGLDITCENVNSNQLNVSEKYILTNKKIQFYTLWGKAIDSLVIYTNVASQLQWDAKYYTPQALYGVKLP